MQPLLITLMVTPLYQMYHPMTQHPANIFYTEYNTLVCQLYRYLIYFTDALRKLQQYLLISARNIQPLAQ